MGKPMIDIVSYLERNDGLFADLHCYVNQDYVAAIKKEEIFAAPPLFVNLFGTIPITFTIYDYVS